VTISYSQFTKVNVRGTFDESIMKVKINDCTRIMTLLYTLSTTPPPITFSGSKVNYRL